MIHLLAHGMTKKLLSNSASDLKQMEVYAYGMELLLLMIANLVIVIIAARLLGVTGTTLVFLAAFVPFRAFGGGVHMKTYLRCLFVGSGSMVGGGYLATTYANPNFIWVLLIPTLLLALYAIIEWVPAAPKGVILNPEIIRMQKRNMFAVTFIWVVMVGILMMKEYWSFSLALVLGAEISLLLISPLGFKLMGGIDSHLDKVIGR